MRLASVVVLALTLGPPTHAQPTDPPRFTAADMLEVRTLAAGQPVALSPGGVAQGQPR